MASRLIKLLTSITIATCLLAPVTWAATATEQLQSILHDHWQYSLREDPITAGRMGTPDYNDRLPGVSAQDRARRLKAEQEFLARLKRIDETQLSQSDRINRELLTWVLENSIESSQLYLDRIPFNTFYSFWAAALEANNGLAMNRVKDYEDYIARIKDFGRYFDENIANMRQGIKDGFVQPKIVVEGVAPTVRAQVKKDPKQSSLYTPFENFPSAISPKEQQRLRRAGEKAIAESAIPAFARLADFLETDYLQAATDSIAAEALPGGKDYYRHTIKTYVTLDMDPAEIHKIGLAEVKRIRAEMDQLIKESGFKGNFAEFTQFLRSDPQFYARTPKELLKEAAYVAKKIDYQLPQFFGKLPRLPYGVVPVPEEIAPNYTTASYNPAAIGGTRGGAYWVNTYALDQRPLYELPALTLHEAVPGHHLQGALSQELENVPAFRRNLYLSAFGEGWGLYAERLGKEMDDVYTTPYEHFGRLSYEMWRAARLVIDTGIHSQGWTRQQALDFLADNTALSKANVRAEVDRYISWPGQALSYKMGEIKIRQLREKAEKTLGDKFDLRAFHDAVLANGALPLELLEEQIEQFINRTQKL
ncbi:DUF885 domain-containing protein [Microbulbifer thermotolerans]|uniref:DUF885 domain-containing protein n=1 Tax=Microbulbifer thermotolerans TaxID=252514 RepID=UPI00224A74D4|nr:DUF885 domain-containing protein [Microbulbifer thermotolerans]MCX2779119.1 DUF885 domain-containing protein [Microbulbifer thermotolerans]MCX2805249.1 DUF885 domain-containing protein [Microbulbifer thermotolerans]WKT60756.1 DUF885 domain-containing protein [Microbulbifer thermotolerans]